MDVLQLIGRTPQQARDMVQQHSFVIEIEALRPQGNKHADWQGEGRVVRAQLKQHVLKLTVAPFLPALL